MKYTNFTKKKEQKRKNKDIAKWPQKCNFKLYIASDVFWNYHLEILFFFLGVKNFRHFFLGVENFRHFFSRCRKFSTLFFSASKIFDTFFDTFYFRHSVSKIKQAILLSKMNSTPSRHDFRQIWISTKKVGIPFEFLYRMSKSVP